MRTIVTLSILAIASGFDVITRKIPNWITFPAMLLGIGYSIYAREAIIAKIALVLFFFMFGALRYMGMGDIKLIMTLILLENPFLACLSVVVAAILAVITAECIKQGNTRNGLFVLNAAMISKTLPKAREGARIPFAPCLLIGYLITKIGWWILC